MASSASTDFELNPLLMIDGYKADHRRQYPEGTEFVYSNFTPRKSRVEGCEFVVSFGLQYFLKRYLTGAFNGGFFQRSRSDVVNEYQSAMNEYLGDGSITVDHIADLHDLGYLPIRIKALPEGSICPIKVPLLTIENTHPRFFWLTNQLETIMSSSLWTGATSATLAYLYRLRFDAANRETGLGTEFSKFQGHDFSFRGMSSFESATISGAAHLTSFAGTDTVPAIWFAKKYYNADGLIGCSVPATEHSVMCLGGVEDEIGTYRRLINEVYPSGIVSIVSDTWDFWSIMTTGAMALKEDILRRAGQVVFRPDSGDPVKIVCGDPDAPEGTPERAGAMQCLWDVFGGEVVSGYKRLNPHVGLIYGDSITLERQESILSGLMKKGFAPNIVLGIGSYTYQYRTRDTFGFAMKATAGTVSGEFREIFKDPKTDHGSEKKSAKGLLRVNLVDGKLALKDQCSHEESNGGELKTVFEDGRITMETTLAEIRHRLHGDLF